MATIPLPRFYVYTLARPDNRVFYVGKGKGRRVFEHDTEAQSGHKCHKCNIIRKIWKQGGRVQRYIVFTTDDESEAFAYEQELIASFRPGTLANKTTGGEGMSGHVFSEESRRKMSKSHKGQVPWSKGRIVPEEQRRKIAATLRGRPLAPHVAEKFRRVNIGRRYSEERRRNIALGQTGGAQYTIVAPDGTIYEHVANVLAFAEEHGLSKGLHKAVTHTHRRYRGWYGWKEGTPPRQPPRSYTIVAPDGTRYTGVINPNAFAKKHGLDAHQLRTVLRGKRPHYKKWTGYSEDTA